MIQPVEEFLDVRVQDPFGAALDMQPDVDQGVVTATSAAEPILMGGKVCLPFRFQCEHNELL